MANFSAALKGSRMVRYHQANDNRPAVIPGSAFRSRWVGLQIPRTLTIGYGDFSDLNGHPALRVSLIGNLAGGLNF
jgi:hypothetical protein